MAEHLTVTTPPVPAVDVSYRVSFIAFDWDEARIVIRLVGSNGEKIGHQYTGATASTLMRALNKLDLSALSLQRRVMQRLVNDSVITGEIGGTPD